MHENINFIIIAGIIAIGAGFSLRTQASS